MINAPESREKVRATLGNGNEEIDCKGVNEMAIVLRAPVQYSVSAKSPTHTPHFSARTYKIIFTTE